MINEKIISVKFSHIWKENLPILTRGYMTLFNQTQIVEVNKNKIPAVSEVRYDLISEVGFKLAKEIKQNQTSINLYLKGSDKLKDIIIKTANIIWQPNSFSEQNLNLNDIEYQQCLAISSNIIEFIDGLEQDKIVFYPKVKGYGIIPELFADLSIGDTLYEIKSVNSNFASSHLKQLILYLALGQISGNKEWLYGGLYNPRKGVYCKFMVEKLIYSLSGGMLPNEVFRNLLNSLIREIQLDIRF